MARRYVNKEPFPGTPTELAELLSDPAEAAEKMGGTAAEWRRFHAEYAARAGGNDPSIDVQVREQVQRELANLLRADGKQIKRLNLDPGVLPVGGRNALHNRKAPGAKLDNLVANSTDLFGDVFGGLWHGNSTENGAAFKAGVLKVQNAYSSTVPSDGGFLIPETMRTEILSLAIEQSIVRSRARVIPMGSLRVPIPAVDDKSHASSLYGGITTAWTEESASITASDASFARVVLEAKKLAAFANVPNELIEDSGGALGAFLELSFPGALAFAEDAAFLGGTGVGEPLGVLDAGNGGLISVARTTANKIKWADIVNMVARLLPASLSKAVWIASPAALPQLAQLQSVVQNVAGTENVGGSAVWLTDGTSGAPMSILGRPLLFSEKADNLGSAGDLALVDLSTYLIGDRQTMTLRSSEHARFQNDETSFRAIERVDGRPWVQSPITPKNGGSTLSPYVRLAA